MVPREWLSLGVPSLLGPLFLVTQDGLASNHCPSAARPQGPAAPVPEARSMVLCRSSASHFQP